MKADTMFSAPTLIGPGSFYVTGEDNLRLTVRNSATGITVTLEGRFLTIGGDVLPFVRAFVPATDRSASTIDVRLGDGWILNATVRVSAGTSIIGQTFAQLRVMRGLNAAAISIGTLVQGYASDADDLAWPGAPIRSSLEGPGWLRSLTITDPGSDFDFSQAVPTGARWRPLSLRFRFATDIAGGNREPQLRLTDGTNEYARVPCGVNQAAGTSIFYSWFHTCPRGAGATSTAVIAPLPRVDMLAAHTIGTLTEGLALGDQYLTIQLLVEEWIEA